MAHQKRDALYRLLTVGADKSKMEGDLPLLAIEPSYTEAFTIHIINAHKCATLQNKTSRVVTATPRGKMHKSGPPNSKKFLLK